VLGPARYLADFARFIATKGTQERHDAQALAELQAAPLGLPAGLELEWLGVSGYRMTFEGQTLFIDAYVSRVSLRDVLRRAQAVPAPGPVGRYLGGCDSVVGVVVGHTHFDHAVDARAVVRRYGCPAHGSRSLTQLMALHGLADRVVEVEPTGATRLARSRSTSRPACTQSCCSGSRSRSTAS
jgi:L-ascorbate metabolism protein UlaG (beta-lactamase superfamily)